MRNYSRMLKVISKELSYFSYRGIWGWLGRRIQMNLVFVSPLQGDFMDEILFSRGCAIAPPRAVTFRPFRAIFNHLQVRIKNYALRTPFSLTSRLPL